MILLKSCNLENISDWVTNMVLRDASASKNRKKMWAYLVPNLILLKLVTRLSSYSRFQGTFSLSLRPWPQRNAINTNASFGRWGRFWETSSICAEKSSSSGSSGRLRFLKPRLDLSGTTIFCSDFHSVSDQYRFLWTAIRGFLDALASLDFKLSVSQSLSDSPFFSIYS